MTLPVAERLAAALETGDDGRLRSLCRPDAVFWSSFLDRDLDIATLCAVRAAERAVAPALALREVRVVATADGFVQRMRVRGPLPDGSAVDIPVCLVVDVVDGLVSRIEEYVDGRSVTPLARLVAVPPRPPATRRRAAAE